MLYISIQIHKRKPLVPPTSFECMRSAIPGCDIALNVHLASGYVCMYVCMHVCMRNIALNVYLVSCNAHSFIKTKMAELSLLRCVVPKYCGR